MPDDAPDWQGPDQAESWSDTQQNWLRRFEHLRDLGLDKTVADQLAASDIPLHEIRSLLEHGCSAELVVRILS